MGLAEHRPAAADPTLRLVDAEGAVCESSGPSLWCAGEDAVMEERGGHGAAPQGIAGHEDERDPEGPPEGAGSPDAASAGGGLSNKKRKKAINAQVRSGTFLAVQFRRPLTLTGVVEVS